MILRLYATLIFCWDVCIILIFFVLTLFKSAYQFVRPPKPKSLSAEVAVVIGSSRGIGNDLAVQLAQYGAKVACVDINSADNDLLVNRIKSSGGICLGFECDVTNKSEVDRTVEAIEYKLGHITMLFHCCNVPSARSLLSKPMPVLDTLNTGVLSHFLLLDTILPKMKKSYHGHIVFLTSVAGLNGYKHQMPLAVSQFAVQGLFESILEELRIEKMHNRIHVTLAHIYPFVITEHCLNDIRLRLPSAFGTIKSDDAARRILDGVRRNQHEISIPRYLLSLSHIFRLLPRNATLLLRELFDTGVDL